MKQYEEVFFEVLRAGLWRTPAHVPSDFRDWASVMKIARSQAVTGLVGDVLLTSPDILSTVPAPIQQKLQDIPLNNMAMHTMLNNTLIMVTTTLREHGIESVLLKGQGVSRYYPVPELRQCGDIDLYVGEDMYEPAYEALKDVVSEIDEKSVLPEGKHFHAKVGSVLLEIHRFADNVPQKKMNRLYQELSRTGLTDNTVKMDFGGVLIDTPADSFNVFYLFHHLWHHFITEGVGFRQITDIACFLHSRYGNLDLDYLKHALDGMDLMRPWQVFGLVMVEWLGLPAAEMPFYEPNLRPLASKVVAKVLTEGNFGQQTSYVRTRRRNYIYEKMFSLKCHLTRTATMMSIFPKHAVVSLVYTMSSGIRMVFKDIFRSKR